MTKRVVDAMRADEIIWDADVAEFGVRRQRLARVYVFKIAPGQWKATALARQAARGRRMELAARQFQSLPAGEALPRERARFYSEA